MEHAEVAGVKADRAALLWVAASAYGFALTHGWLQCWSGHLLHPVFVTMGMGSSCTSSGISRAHEACTWIAPGCTSHASIVQIMNPTWATTTAPAPAISAPAVGVQFIMSGVSTAQLNQTLLRCVAPGLRTCP